MQDAASNSSDNEDLDIDAFFLPGGILNDDYDPQQLLHQHQQNAQLKDHAAAATVSHEKAPSSYGSADLASMLTTTPAGFSSNSAAPPSQQQQQQQSSPVPVNPWDETVTAAAAAPPPPNLNHNNIQDCILAEQAQLLIPPDANNTNNDDAVVGGRCAETSDDIVSSWLLQSSRNSSGLEISSSSRHSSRNRATSSTGLELQVDDFNSNNSNHSTSGSWVASTATTSTTNNSKTTARLAPPPPPGLAPPAAVPKPPPGFEGVVVTGSLSNESSSSSSSAVGVHHIPDEERVTSNRTTAAGAVTFAKGRPIDNKHKLHQTEKTDAAPARAAANEEAPVVSVGAGQLNDQWQQSPDLSSNKLDVRKSALENNRRHNRTTRESEMPTLQKHYHQSSGFSSSPGSSADAAATAHGESLVVVRAEEKSLTESGHSSSSKTSSSGKRNKKKNKPSSSASSSLSTAEQQPLLDSTTTNSSAFPSPTAFSSADHHAKEAHLTNPEIQVEESLPRAIYNVFAAIVAGIFQTSPTDALAGVAEMYRALVDPMVQSTLGAVVLLVKYIVICCFALGNVFRYAFEEAALDYHISRLMYSTRQSHHDGLTLSFSCYLVLYLSPFLSDMLMSNTDCPHYTPHIISNVALYALSMRLTGLSSIDYASGAPAKRGKPSVRDSNNGVTAASAKPSSAYIPESDRRQLEYDFCHRILRSLRYAIPCSFVLEGFSDANASFAMADAPVRLVLAYLLSLVRHGLLLSPLAWIGWSTQILLAAYLPGGFLLDLFLVVVGLAFIRLVSTLHHEQRRF